MSTYVRADALWHVHRRRVFPVVALCGESLEDAFRDDGPRFSRRSSSARIVTTLDDHRQLLELLVEQYTDQVCAACQEELKTDAGQCGAYGLEPPHL